MFQYFSRRSPHAKFRDGLIFTDNFNFFIKKLALFAAYMRGKLKFCNYRNAPAAFAAGA